MSIVHGHRGRAHLCLSLAAALAAACASAPKGGDASSTLGGGGGDVGVESSVGVGAGGNVGVGSGSGGAGAGGAPIDPGPTDHVTAVWAVNDGEKVERDDLAHPAKTGNTAWDGHVARLFGGRNEVLALQIVVESGPAGVGALSVSLPSLKRRGGPEQIVYSPPAQDPTDYVGRPIQIFSEGYVEVVNPTEASWIVESGSPSAPDDMIGWKPVQLVPENATPGKGGFPLSVAPQQNQGIWIDVYVGRDLPAGVYDGRIRVETDGELREIPIELEVLSFTLPDENAVAFMLYYEGGQVQEYQGANLDDRYHRFAHRNRVELVRGYDVASATAHMGRFDGSDFEPGSGYEGPGEGVGNRVIPRSFYGPGATFKSQSSAWSASDAWMSFLSAELPEARTFLYMVDEPGSGQFPEIQSIADNIHGNPGPGSALPIFVTHGYTAQLASAIDIWCAGAKGYDQARAETERSEGDDMWYYNGRRPNIGSLVIDTPATDARVHGWGAFARSIPVYFYWHSNHWHHNGSAPSGYDKKQDVWANPMTFINGSGEFANGDGVLVYPGQETIHPDQDRGIAGPVSTIQMANLRRGAQDAIYLAMARACGLEPLVAASIDAIVPHVFSDAGSQVSFPEVGDAYEVERRKLADALAACP